MLYYDPDITGLYNPLYRYTYTLNNQFFFSLLSWGVVEHWHKASSQHVFSSSVKLPHWALPKLPHLQRFSVVWGSLARTHFCFTFNILNVPWKEIGLEVETFPTRSSYPKYNPVPPGKLGSKPLHWSEFFQIPFLSQQKCCNFLVVL